MRAKNFSIGIVYCGELANGYSEKSMAGVCPQLSELQGSTASSSKRYRLELGSGDRAKEVFERWQRLRQKDSNIRLLHKALDLLENLIVPSCM